MTRIGPTIRLQGELRASEDVTIEGRIDGPVLCERSAVLLEPSAQVAGDIVARDITVSGRANGQLIATEVVEVRAGAVVTGTILSGRLILHDGASFHGRVEPQHLEAAVRVARFEQRKRDTVASS
jgi:cytoskeletal protein CcmA (bactofilin family)